jgi:YegS/Rv2252/BmrU family lipid kinase
MRFVVYNPQAAGGRTGREWPGIAKRLEAAVGAFAAQPTRARDDATRLVREAVANGASEVIAIGGDGTISEAINGLFDGAMPARSPVTFGFVSAGTGSDFARMFGIAGGLDAACARLAAGRTQRIDVGRLSFRDEQGRPAVRYFNNTASLGLSGATARAVNGASLSRFLGPRAMFRYHSVAELIRYRFPRVGYSVDGAAQVEERIATLVVANGCYFGSGMKIAPDADLADGMLEVVVVKGESKSQLIAAMNLVYTGRHLSHPAVRALRGRRIDVVPLDEAESGPVLLEVDGESPGRLPATFEVLPDALTLRC